MGDDIQALKAGLLEIADVIVVNKADRPGAKRTVVALQSVHTGAMRGHHRTEFNLTTSQDAPADEGTWQVPILETSATSGQGIEALVDAIVAHKAYLQETQMWRERQTQRARASVRMWLQRHFEDHFDRCVDPQTVEVRIQKVADREQDPSGAARALLEAYLSQIKTGCPPPTP